MDSDYQTALLLQAQLDYENAAFSNNFIDSPDTLSDSQLAHNLQDHFNQELNTNTSKNNLVVNKTSKEKDNNGLVDPSWEVVDPTPDIHVLFVTFNTRFFWDKLGAVRVTWSKQMKRCAGICSYTRAGGCHISLSEPLLKLRPRKDLVETLLHEMIHAFLFLTHNNRDREGHGPEFHKHMHRINKEAGTNITVYHSFHDEVELYLTHWWRCDGPCQKWKPYFGIVRRSMNRAPGPNDKWFGAHSRNCGGTFIKIRSPSPTKKNSKVKKGKENTPTNSNSDIRKFLNITPEKKPDTKPGVKSLAGNSKNIQSVFSNPDNLSIGVTISSSVNNIHGFSNSAAKEKPLLGKGQSIRSKSVSQNEDSSYKKENKNIQNVLSNKNSSVENDMTDLDVVRKHWLNKFSTNNSSNSSSLKRTTYESMKSPKKPKLDSASSISHDVLDKSQNIIVLNDSQDAVMLSNSQVQCPVCSKLYSIKDIDIHLDECLKNPKVLKECIICSEHIEENSYEDHLNKCINLKFKNENTNNESSDIQIVSEDSLDIEEVTCKHCDKMISLNLLDDHLQICQDLPGTSKSNNKKQCSLCNANVTEKNYDHHVEECLLKRMNYLEENLFNDSQKIDCLACGKNILKSILNSHLEECMSISQVFDVSSDSEIELSIPDNSKDIQDSKTNELNCPICFKIFHEEEINFHIDQCLESSDLKESFQ